MGADEKAVKTKAEVAAPDPDFDPYYRPRDTRTKWQKFKDDIYNPREHTFLGRTTEKWGVFGLFYLVFYICLAILCTLCGMGLMWTIDRQRPTFTLEKSLIGTSPGMGFRPVSNNTAEMPVISFNSQNASSVLRWISYIELFLEKYRFKEKLPNAGRNQVICDYKMPPQVGKVCAVDVEQLGPCSPGTNYGFNQAAPCIFVKLNKIFDWTPTFYNDSKNLPDVMPEDLKNHIRSVGQKDPAELNAIWISCQGENANDKKNIGEIEYFPKARGFPGYYYPFTNQPEYLSPIVAVHFLRPKRNTLIGVECRAWAKNIHYSSRRGEKAGAVHFELYINTPDDSKNKTQ